jgi:predicted nuclease of predicted toxin-antitoxin system
MGRLAFCTDEHVPHAFLTTLQSNGFTVVDAAAEHGGTQDGALLDWCSKEGYVLISNDRDFAKLTQSREHAGLIVYTTQTLSPGEFVRGIRRIDRQFTPDSIVDTVCWLDGWV